jgi:hypothetical protein
MLSRHYAKLRTLGVNLNPMMRHIYVLTFLFQILTSGSFGQTGDSQTVEYKNLLFRFSVDIPINWKLYGQVTNDTINHRAIVDWGIPLVYSELEKSDIENSISITAYRKAEIQNIDQLFLFERQRTKHLTDSVQFDKNDKNGRIIYSTINGLNYKSKLYFIIKNGIGYILTFTATPGTYDKNIELFERFSRKVKFL